MWINWQIITGNVNILNHQREKKKKEAELKAIDEARKTEGIKIKIDEELRLRIISIIDNIAKKILNEFELNPPKEYTWRYFDGIDCVSFCGHISSYRNEAILFLSNGKFVFSDMFECYRKDPSLSDVFYLYKQVVKYANEKNITIIEEWQNNWGDVY